MTGKIPVKPWAVRLRLRFLTAAGEPYQSYYRLDWGPEDADDGLASVGLGFLSSVGTLDMVVNGNYGEGLLYFGETLGADYKTAAKIIMRVVLKRPKPLMDLPYRLSNLGYMAVEPNDLFVLNNTLTDATMRFQNANDLSVGGKCDGIPSGPATQDRLVQVHDRDAAKLFK